MEIKIFFFEGRDLPLPKTNKNKKRMQKNKNDHHYLFRIPKSLCQKVKTTTFKINFESETRAHIIIDNVKYPAIIYPVPTHAETYTSQNINTVKKKYDLTYIFHVFTSESRIDDSIVDSGITPPTKNIRKEFRSKKSKDEISRIEKEILFFTQKKQKIEIVEEANDVDISNLPPPEDEIIYFKRKK